jgi:hypothetical protein
MAIDISSPMSSAPFAGALSERLRAACIRPPGTGTQTTTLAEPGGTATFISGPNLDPRIPPIGNGFTRCLIYHLYHRGMVDSRDAAGKRHQLQIHRVASLREESYSILSNHFKKILHIVRCDEHASKGNYRAFPSGAFKFYFYRWFVFSF